jgi:hypothetical protein
VSGRPACRRCGAVLSAYRAECEPEGLCAACAAADHGGSGRGRAQGLCSHRAIVAPSCPSCLPRLPHGPASFTWHGTHPSETGDSGEGLRLPLAPRHHHDVRRGTTPPRSRSQSDVLTSGTLWPRRRGPDAREDAGRLRGGAAGAQRERRGSSGRRRGLIPPTMNSGRRGLATTHTCTPKVSMTRICRFWRFWLCTHRPGSA